MPSGQSRRQPPFFLGSKRRCPGAEEAINRFAPNTPGVQPRFCSFHWIEAKLIGFYCRVQMGKIPLNHYLQEHTTFVIFRNYQRSFDNDHIEAEKMWTHSGFSASIKEVTLKYPIRKGSLNIGLIRLRTR